VFDSVRIMPDDKLDADGTIPMNITVTERKQHVVGGAVYYSNTEGSGVETYWRHRNLWGGAEQLEVRGAVSRLGQDGFTPDYRLGSILKKPGILDPLTDGTLRVEGYRQTTDAYRVTALESEATLSRLFSDTLTGSIGFETQRSRTDDAAGTQDHFIVGLRGRLEWDTRDNKLDPLRGYRNQLLLAPARDLKYDENFVTVGDDVSIYRAFGTDERFVLAGRIALYSLAARNVLDVPADRRLYAGGGGSVRGYEFRSISPENSDGDEIGGRSSITGSVELRYRFLEDFGIVPFFDAGTVSPDSAPNFDEPIQYAAGIGFRYYTAFGPIRADIAVPLNPRHDDDPIAFYVSIGQAF
jgi:translocation and assembly module TamA